MGKFLQRGKVSKRLLEENFRHKDETFCGVKEGNQLMW